MSEKSGLTVFTFGSTHQALRAEKVLLAAQIEAQVIPVPRRISSLCGLAVQVDTARRQEAQEALEAAGVRIEGIYSGV